MPPHPTKMLALQIFLPLMTYLEAIRQGLYEEMERDETVFVMGEDVGVYGGAFKVTKGLIERFGERRVIDTPLSESAIVGAGTGAAINGLRPVLEMQFSDFMACAFDQITNFKRFNSNGINQEVLRIYLEQQFIPLATFLLP